MSTDQAVRLIGRWMAVQLDMLLDRPHLVKELEEVGPRAVAGARVCLGICPEGGPRTGRVQYQRIVPPNIC